MKALKIFVPIILLALTVYYCSTVPITGRSQLSLSLSGRDECNEFSAV